MVGCLLSCFREQMLKRIRQITDFIFTQGGTGELVKLLRVLILNSSAMARLSVVDPEKYHSYSPFLPECPQLLNRPPSPSQSRHDNIESSIPWSPKRIAVIQFRILQFFFNYLISIGAAVRPIV